MLRDLVGSAGSPVPRPLASIVRRATAADPAARYPDAAAFAVDLGHWLDDERVLAHREGMAERLWRFARRHQVALLLLLAYVVLRTAILLWRGI
jgi:serine/threonine-protein kinase